MRRKRAIGTCTYSARLIGLDTGFTRVAGNFMLLFFK
jgi:hypothetical protein